MTPYERNTFSEEELILDQKRLINQEWNEVQFIIPDMDGALIDEVGVILQSHSSITNRAIGCLYIDNFQIYGEAAYSIDFAKQFEEFKCVTPFAHNRGEWLLQNDFMKCISDGECSSFIRDYYTKDIIIEADITPISRVSHGLIFRALGIKRHYLIGFDGEGKASLILNDFGHQRLVSVPFNWESDKKYRMKLICKVLEHESDHLFGFGSLEKGEWNISACKVNEEV